MEYMTVAKEGEFMNNKSKHYLHGGDLDSISYIYGIPRDEIIDFSGNINPLGISPLAKEELSKNLDLISTYPDRNYTSLRNEISNYVGAKAEHIIVGNGATELISLMMQIKSPKNAIIVGPTYSEYEREILLVGGKVQYFPLKEDLDFQLDTNEFLTHLTSDVDLLVICNPNNPTSTCIYSDQLEKILTFCKKNNIFVLIDETYIEFVENMDTITAVPFIHRYNNLMILRGISKFFSSPGLRLGYGICSNEDLLSQINSYKNPWTINILASFGAELMFQDKKYINRTKGLFNTERTKIYKEMSCWKNIKLYQPEANFVLFKLLRSDIRSQDVFEKMIAKKMLIRDASSFPFLNDRFLRFCFLLPEQNEHLLQELKVIIEQ